MTLEEYMRELWLAERQYGQEEELYPLINMLLRENDNVSKLSIRDVHKGQRNGGHEMLYGYASFPDLAILDEAFDPREIEEKLKGNSNIYEDKNLIELIKKHTKKMYGCVEVKQINEEDNLEKFAESQIIGIGYIDIVKIRKAPENGIYYHVYMCKKLDNKDNVTKDLWGYYNKYVDVEENVIKSFFGDSVEGFLYYNGIQDVTRKIEDYNICKYQIMIDRQLKDINEGKSQLLGELLWYGKVIYTDGIRWKYLERKNDIEKEIIFMDKEEINNFDVEFTCVEIGDLSKVFKIVEKKENIREIEKLFYLNDDTTFEWLKAWERLKYNLACINWRGENNPDQFIH